MLYQPSSSSKLVRYPYMGGYEVDPRDYPPDPNELSWKQKLLNRVITVLAVIVVAILLAVTTRVGLGSNVVFLNAIGWVLLIALAGLLISVALLAVIHLRTPARS